MTETVENLERKRHHATRRAYDYAAKQVGDSKARHFSYYYGAAISDEDTIRDWPNMPRLFTQWYSNRYVTRNLDC
jgi:hypothetical protein